ncbi:AbgT family transporter [Bacteroidales bacterium OttesenSCG-928-B11]|nr:AbgT family transporter [Bacteroidales bacterium OttesenSCG-928-B11]MDL2325912.1 AbgT family transporter [Bacteroidales bacterium OttesenSCG-928-A14]
MKQIKIPHTFTIVFSIIVVCALLTWIIPGGEFAREVIVVDGTERNVVVADSFENIDHEPQTWQIFTAFFKGFVRTANIIVFILMIGGAFWIMNSTKAIDVGIMSFLRSTQKLQQYAFFKKVGVNNLVVILIMVMFSLFGAIFGMSEETIAFIIIFVPLAISMGYDSITGVLMCYVAAHVGFAGAMLNPFTIGIAQGLSGLPPFSGIEYRFICWLVLTVIAIVFTLIYCSRIKKRPERSPVYKLDQYWRNREADITHDDVDRKASLTGWIVFVAISAVMLYCAIAMPFTAITIGSKTYNALIFPIVAGIFIIFGFIAIRKSIHNFILMILLLTIIMLVVGVLGYHWYVMEIAALFFAMGFAAGFAYDLKFDQSIRLFLEGCKDIMVAALVVGMAGGIIIILEDGKIIDTILYAISQSMVNSGEEGAIGAMYLIQNLLNIIIPSGSAKAALTIPMMAEFSDIIGVSRQLTVLAFQFGDGFTNMITPTSGVLIGVLGVAKVPYAKWVKFIWPFIIGLILVGFVLLLLPLYINFNGF